MGCGYLRAIWTYTYFVFYYVFLLLLSDVVSSHIRYSLQEESKIGTILGNIGKDLGLESSALTGRKLRIVTGSKQELFHVNQKEGLLFVNGRIDREELCATSNPCLISIKAVIENPLEMHQITVEIIDVNDNAPTFPDNVYNMETLESAMTGTRYQLEGAHDPDIGSNALQSYKLAQNLFFRLETDDFGEGGKVPVLVLQKLLDRENSARHTLLLTAIDGGKPQKTGTLTINVVVSDINDNAPFCGKQKYTVKVKEDAPVGTFLLRINATDSDEGENGEIEFSLRSKFKNGASDLFDLNSKTGELRIKGGLNFEEKQVYELKILAADKGAVSLSTQCNVLVKVEDVNDNRPEIDITSLSDRISEDARPGTVVALMGVTDLDSGVNGQVVCSLSENIPFELKQSADLNFYTLVTKWNLDKESQSFYDIVITAKDLGTPPTSSTKTIHVQVTDVNDNSPVFIQSPFTFYVSENNNPGTSVFSVSATDVDDGENARVSYSIDHANSDISVTSLININDENGAVFALKSFDFESMKRFQFHVLATDSGTPPLSSNVTVNVFILDQNDNVPVILYPVSANGSAEGMEEIPRNVNAGHLVTKVRAYDADIGYNGWLLFSLQEVSDHSLFGLDRYTGHIRTLRPFTESDEAEHKLVILVKDNGNVSLSATATVLFKLVEPKEAFAPSDVKNSVKNIDEYNITFYLIITLGSVSFLFIISIIILILMQCSKSTDYSKHLQNPSYDGTLCHSIQYRSGDKRYMLVEPRRSIGSTIVPGSNGNTLVVRDRRRTSGEVPGHIRYSVPEETKEGTVVGNIAKDLGIDGSRLMDRRLRIVSGSKEALFKVNQDNGILYVQKKIDREEICDDNDVCLINIKIAVENPLQIYYIGIEIADINDHAPSFADKQVNFEVAENKAPGARLDLQPARDPDMGANSIRTYKLSQNEHFTLEIKDVDEDRIPSLVLQKYLDRESILEHRLLLTALDGGNPQKSGTLNITITVLDTNDNQPVCSQDVYSLSLNENVPVGKIVLRVNATDPDESSNGEIEYSWGRNTKSKIKDIFQVNHISGEIQVKKEIDFEDIQIYRLNIQASDKGQPPLSVDCKVIIKIIDVNDNKPEIDVTSILNTVPEDSKPGTVISFISVTDRDSGINGKVVCRISDDLPFELKPSVEDNVYSLITSKLLDRELISRYDIVLTAEDMGQPALSSLKYLNVDISDINDNLPQFPQNPFELYLLENNVPGSSIFSVSANDKDMNENSEITYQIMKDEARSNDLWSVLNINTETGVIHALKSFDFETTKTFQFHVLATDSGTPPLSSNVTVNVFILDQNDNVPVILYPVSANGSAEGMEEIPHNVNAGHLVTKVRAYDADIGYNGWLLFSLQEVTDHSLFGLDRYTGQIRTLRPFTESDEAKHKLVILVKDNGNVSLSATATVIIKLVEPKEPFAAPDVKNAVNDVEENNVTFYLIITLGSVSFLFIVSLIVLIVMQCSKSTDYSSKYLQDANYDGTLCHSIQYRSGDKRYMLVGPRTSIGSTIVPGSAANTLVIEERMRRTSGEVSAIYIDN
ncbi:Protocadherin gamma-A8 [Bagarius yarrelli]|uniref:Protocadherin gamma-A8 n=1 Tax=Bagarius yarrelli TaxID=175774 RepID=A0A556TRM8_BAGYA|nr:Protocadherin gamma-A8 [Bagarius yarrelli]